MSLEVGKSDGTSLYTTALGRVKAVFLLVRNGYCTGINPCLGGEVASRLRRLTKKRSYELRVVEMDGIFGVRCIHISAIFGACIQI